MKYRCLAISAARTLFALENNAPQNNAIMKLNRYLFLIFSTFAGFWQLIAALASERVLVDHAVFHDHTDGFDAFFPRRSVKPFIVAADRGIIFQRIAIDNQNVCVGTDFDNAQVALRIP